MDYKIALGIVASGVGLVGYVPYFRDIFRGTTKPHVFSWFVWGLLTGIAFFVQLAKGGGAGSWVTGITAVACFVIAGLALKYGEKGITTSDRLSFAGAILGIVLWQLTENPLTAVILVTLIDALGFLPTFRKAYHKPHEETASTFVFSSLKFAIGIIALQSLTLATWLYPASLVIMNGAFVVMLVVRRRVGSLDKTS